MLAGSESVAAPCMKLPLHPPIDTEHEAGQDASTVFQIFGMTRQGIELSLPALVARAQPTVLPLLAFNHEFC